MNADLADDLAYRSIATRVVLSQVIWTAGPIREPHDPRSHLICLTAESAEDCVPIGSEFAVRFAFRSCVFRHKSRFFQKLRDRYRMPRR
jgi:hypothetical protein